MIVWVVVFALIGVVAVAWGVAHIQYRTQMQAAQDAWHSIATGTAESGQSYDPSMVADMPEIAQRYFNHAIAPGTPLSTLVELHMAGTLLLGEKDAPRVFDMEAQQILHAPTSFVWMADLRSGPMHVTGTDGLTDGHGWTRFWMFWSIPLVQASATEALDRSAAARPALESIWAPVALLPQNGAVWQQTGDNTARVTVTNRNLDIEMDLTLAADGAVEEIVTQRWSNENPQQVYRLQPFGGTIEAEASFGGYTVPSVVHVGNHFGTEDYFAFFNATIRQARFR